MAVAAFLLVIVGAEIAIDQVISLQAAAPNGKPVFCSTKGEQCFSYNETSLYGPRRWDKVCQTKRCFSGLNQSPILIDNDTVQEVCDMDIRPHYTNNPVVSGRLLNEGLHPSVEGIKGAELSGVPGFSGKFDLVAIHFHFRGGPKNRGTEHQVDDADYDAEMHLVHVNQNVHQGLVSTAQSGLTVVAVFLSTEEGETSVDLDKILNNVDKIKEYRLRHCREFSKHTRDCPDDVDGCTREGCQEVEVEFHPDGLLPVNRDFFYYYGSLTTPPLTEAVSWNVMYHPIKITDDQLRFLQDLQSREESVLISRDGNVRPLQPLNGRTVFFNTCDD